jgi:ribonuclease Z
LLLFDTGRGTTTQLTRAGIPCKDINHLFITHHHFDHISGLGDFILSGWNLGRTKNLSIFGPSGTQSIVNQLLNEVYKSDIAFRQREAQVSGVSLADLKPLVKPVEVTPGLVFDNYGVQVYCDFVQHGHGLGISQDEWPCLAYRIEAEKKSICISGDTVDCESLHRLANNTDALVMCCYLSRKEMQDKEGALIGEHILACAPQVRKIAAKANAGKLILTHIRQKSDADMEEVAADIKTDYDGDVIAGKDLIRVQI